MKFMRCRLILPVFGGLLQALRAFVNVTIPEMSRPAIDCSPKQVNMPSWKNE